LAKLSWDNAGEKYFQNGISHGVLYTQSEPNGTWNGVAWNGLTNITESPEGAEKNDQYADNIKYASIRSKEVFNGTIEAYTYPDEFEACDGSAGIGSNVTAHQQTRKPFCLCYRTRLNNDSNPDGDGYLLHLVYNCTASPSERSYETVNDSPDAITFSWEFDTTPVSMDGRSFSTITINSTKADEVDLRKLENRLYGTQNANPVMPMPDVVFALMSGYPLSMTYTIHRTMMGSPYNPKEDFYFYDFETGVVVDHKTVSGTLISTLNKIFSFSKPGIYKYIMTEVATNRNTELQVIKTFLLVANAGYHWVDITSQEIYLTATASPEVATAPSGELAAFSVSVENAVGTIAYQWQCSTDNGATWTDLGGDAAKEADYEIRAYDERLSWIFRCSVTADNGNCVSNSVHFVRPT
jgi:hypothetical protein